MIGPSGAGIGRPHVRPPRARATALAQLEDLTDLKPFVREVTEHLEQSDHPAPGSWSGPHLGLLTAAGHKVIGVNPHPPPARRTAVVTGANTGIGRVTAHELARQGFRVILACRSEAKTLPVIDDIVADTDNPDVEFLTLDLTDLDSVRTAADTLIERSDPLHVLVANAGVAGQRGETAQGFELAFGINHLGHFLFVTRLLDLLRTSADGTDPHEPSRIVVVASDSHFQAKGVPFDQLRRSTKGITGLREYAVSKLSNVLFAQELRRRLDPTGVWVGVLHPGVIASDVWRNVPWPVRPIMTRFMRSTGDGAATSVMCATSADVIDSDVEYWSEMEPKDPNPVATPELAAELWGHSEEWVDPFTR